VWIEAAGEAFPAAGWDDFVVRVVGNVLSATRTISRDGIDVDFYDGPFRVKLAMAGQSELVLTLTRHLARPMSRRVTAGWAPWRRSVLDAAEAVVESYAVNDWPADEDFARLKSELRALRA
jgi:hypothetical protein